ncbi:OadG family protein [Halioxenophilus aromaticivorans]|uniref:Probable oxaloacetate decarboxylase gamma chain n=1 Tax=Halioxenophilus aromaticivorans TaxID=1306992 RepID=A0AAV3TZM5_9ALTE
MNDTLLEQGVELMLFGMGTVFVFLTILVIATFAMSTLIGRYLPEEAAPTPATPTARGGAVDPKVVKIIQAALEQHRSRD